MTRIVAVCAVLLFAAMASAGNVPPLPGWVMGPASMIEKCTSPDTLECTANNGWGLCEQLADSMIGRIHVVYTKTSGSVTKVFARCTDNRGRSWTDAWPLFRPDWPFDSARDAAIACLGCSVAVAFYDDWTDTLDDTLVEKRRYMVYNQSLNSGGGLGAWMEDPKILMREASLEDTQYDNRHPSVALTWKEYDLDEQEGALARVVWVDSMLQDHFRTAWPTSMSVMMRNFGRSFWQYEVSDTWGEYPSVAWNGYPDDENDASVVYEGLEKGTGAPDHEIFGQSYVPGAKTPKQLTANDYYDGRPCVQVLNISTGDLNRDTALVVYESEPGAYTRIMWMRWQDEENNAVIDSAQAFPNWWKERNLGRPNIWRRCDPPDRTNDTVFMVFAAEYPAGIGQFWSILTIEGDTWRTPQRLIGPRSPNASIIGGYRYANVLASLHQTGYGSPNRHYLFFLPLNYVDAVPIEAACAASPARLLQQDAPSSSNLWCAAGTGEYPITLSSTDNGLTWENCGSPGWGGSPALALDGDTIPVVVFLDSNALYCSQPTIDKNIWTPVRVYEAAAGEVIGAPSVALYPGKVGGVKVAAATWVVCDTSAGTFRVMWAKVDTANVLLDTIASDGYLADSFPCVNIYLTDSIYVTWQHGDSIVSSMLEYGASNWDQPEDDWSDLKLVTADGRHPMSRREDSVLCAVWWEEDTGMEPATEVIATACYDLTGAMWSGWSGGSDPSEDDTREKDNPVYAGAGVTVWQEKVSGVWNILGEVRGDTMTLVASDSNSYHPHAIAESSAISPSINQVRVKLLWTEEVIEGGDTFGELRFKVDSLNVSNAGSDATEYNNGCKLMRKPGSDSLFAVFADADDAVMYAYTACGDSWRRELLTQDCEYPAIAEDGTGRRWVVVYGDDHTTEPPLSRVHARYRDGSSWSAPQNLYINIQGAYQVGPASLAGATDVETPCAYAAFQFYNGDDLGNTNFIIVTKFDGTNRFVDTVAASANTLGDPCIAVQAGSGGDTLHVCWENNGEVYYTITDNAVTADDWQGTVEDPVIAWKSPVNLSNTANSSAHPALGLDDDRVAIAWAERSTPDILVRYRSATSGYGNWQDTVNVSVTSEGADYPTVFVGDSVVVVWKEHDAEGTEDDYDVHASVEFGEGFVFENTATKSTYPHVLFQNKSSGDTAIPYIHAIWSEDPQTDFYEVGYKKYNIKQYGTGGGQQSQGGPVIQPILYGCRPNPFTGRTAIRYQFPRAGRVLLRVYDASGRTVRTLQNGLQAPGIYTVNWDGRDDRGRTVANGIYFYRLETPGFWDTRKAVVVR